MSNDEIHNRVAALERHLRNMRMAVIVVVAFFLYESLMPPELRPGRQEKIEDSVKTRALVLMNESGDARARLDVPDACGAPPVLLDGAGHRVSARFPRTTTSSRGSWTASTSMCARASL